jgi:hypothetical protein
LDIPELIPGLMDKREIIRVYWWCLWPPGPSSTAKNQGVNAQKIAHSKNSRGTFSFEAARLSNNTNSWCNMDGDRAAWSDGPVAFRLPTARNLAFSLNFLFYENTKELNRLCQSELASDQKNMNHSQTQAPSGQLKEKEVRQDAAPCAGWKLKAQSQKKEIDRIFLPFPLIMPWEEL